MRRRDSIDYYATAVITVAGLYIVAQGVRFLIG